MKYYIASNNNPRGPFEIETLREIGITPDTLVWHDKLPQWVRADQIDEIRTKVLDLPPVTPAGNTPPPAQAVPGTPYPRPASPSYGNPYGSPYGGQPDMNHAGQQPMPPCPPTHLVFAIIVTVLCCVIPGIIALIYSSKVTSNYNAGLYNEAVSASKTANILCWVGLIGGIAIYIIYLIIFMTNGFMDLLAI